jgi:hypothetical protein
MPIVPFSQRRDDLDESLQPSQTHLMMAAATMPRFDPEGSGYDYDTARDAGLKPDESGHWPSRDPRTGMLLKGKSHPTFEKGVKVDEGLGYRLKKRGDRYYTTQEDED